jgi:dihydroxyacetone kinase-like predicted kinase
LLEDTLIGNGSDAAVVISAVATAFTKVEPEFITIYYGSEITEKEAEKAAEEIGSILGDSEVTLVAGGQPHYQYIISAE